MENNSRVKKGYDFIIIARKPVIKLEYKLLKRETIKLFKKGGFLK